MNQSMRLKRIVTTPVLPVLTIDDAASAIPLARALADGGLTVIEITLRSDAALDAIRQIAAALPALTVGAGTIRTPEQAAAAISAGSGFLVSPGITPRLIEASQHWSIPLLPGAATASEAMALADMGFGIQKFFPAAQLGGVAALKAFAAPLPDIRFCPTGGIDAARALDYLALPNVVCVGGSWVAPPAAVKAGDWRTITDLALAASALGPRL
jgi:2-dehydro-3-deoxyphosphogluconate aldolase / (4S)-4-hydroxy-2-oxoglutarate aldolase